MSTIISGSDASTFVINDEGEADLDPYFLDIDEQTSTAEACARRLLTPNGALPWDEDAGYDLGQFLNADLDPNLALPIRAGVENEVLKDDRVSEAEVTTTIGPRGLSVAVDAYGPSGAASVAIDATGTTTTVTSISPGS